MCGKGGRVHSELLRAPAVNTLVFSPHTQRSASGEESEPAGPPVWFSVRLVGFALHLCSCWEWVMKCRLQHHTSPTNPPPSQSPHPTLHLCSKRPVMVSCSRQVELHKPCWMCRCTTTSCGLQDSKQLTSLLPWHASARTGTEREEEEEEDEGVVYNVSV